MDANTHQHFVASKLHVNHGHLPVTVHCCLQCCLVYHVLEIGASAAGGAASHLVNVDIWRHFHLAHVVIKDVTTTFEIWRKHLHLHVKSART